MRSVLPLALTSVIVAALSQVVSAGATPSACRVVNTSVHRAYPTLQDAVDASTTLSGNTLSVRGTCVGSTSIPDKDLTITGKSSPGFGQATLEGTLEIGDPFLPNIAVELRGLFVRGGNEIGVRSWYGTELRLNDSTVTGSAIGVSNAFGSRLVANDSAFIGNGVGVASIEGSVVILNRSSVSDNSSGGVASNGGQVTVNNSVVSGNSTVGDGGGFWNAGELIINNSTVTDNTASGRGGGIYNLPADATLSGLPGRLTMTATRVTGNTAATGGGIYTYAPITLIGTANVLCPNEPNDPPVPCS
jgi:hypothetical protein